MTVCLSQPCLTVGCNQSNYTREREMGTLTISQKTFTDEFVKTFCLTSTQIVPLPVGVKLEEFEKGYTEEGILAELVESEKDRSRRRMLAIVTETVDAHCLQKMRDLLTFEKLATWRRVNGFDRVTDGEESWYHAPRSLPSTPEEYTVDLWCKVNELKDAISMPRQKVSNLINEIEQGKVRDEEFAILKRLVEKRSRDAAQAQVTVTPVDIVQHCSPCLPNPEMPPDVCFQLENNEGRIDLERGELESPSADMGLETLGQQCPPNEGIWKTGRTTADGFLAAGVGSNQGGSIYSPTERVDTRASTKSTTTSADITFLKQGYKPRDEEKGSEENKQVDPGGKGEKEPLWNAAITLFFLFCGERWAMGGSLLVLCVFCLCVFFCSVL